MQRKAMYHVSHHHEALTLKSMHITLQHGGQAFECEGNVLSLMETNQKCAHGLAQCHASSKFFNVSPREYS